MDSYMLQRFLRATADIQLAFTASSWFPNEGSYGICREIYDQPPICIGRYANLCKPQEIHAMFCLSTPRVNWLWMGLPWQIVSIEDELPGC